MQIEIVAAKGQDRIIETDKAQGKDKDHRGTDRCRIMKHGHPAVVGETFVDQTIDRKRYQHNHYDKPIDAGDDREITEKLEGDLLFRKHDDSAIDGNMIEDGSNDRSKQSHDASFSVEFN